MHCCPAPHKQIQCAWACSKSLECARNLSNMSCTPWKRSWETLKPGKHGCELEYFQANSHSSLPTCIRRTLHACQPQGTDGLAWPATAVSTHETISSTAFDKHASGGAMRAHVIQLPCRFVMMQPRSTAYSLGKSRLFAGWSMAVRHGWARGERLARAWQRDRVHIWLDCNHSCTSTNLHVECTM